LTLKEEIDFYQEFEEWYRKILEAFEFDYERDCKARDVLSQILREKEQFISPDILIHSLKRAIEKCSNVLIYGCGPSLEQTVGKLFPLEKQRRFHNAVNLAADGAALLLKEYKIHMNGIFTDLDGITKEDFNYTDFMIIHAHGDNIDKLNYFKDDIIGCKNIIGTAQCEPLKNIVNPGGFTDGDRILFFLRTFLTTQKVFLIGMDFNNIIGRYSKPKMEENIEGNPIKLKKLNYAVKLLEWLIPQLSCEVYFVNCTKSSEKFNYISIEEFNDLMWKDT